MTRCDNNEAWVSMVFRELTLHQNLFSLSKIPSEIQSTINDHRILSKALTTKLNETTKCQLNVDYTNKKPPWKACLLSETTHFYYYLYYDTDQNWSHLMRDAIQTQITGLQCILIEDAISNKPQKEISSLREFCAYPVYSLSNSIYSHYNFVFSNRRTA